MSIAPCQVCGGTGFIDAPQEAGETQVAPPNPSEAGEYGRPDEMPKIPCPVCSGSGSNTGV